MPPPPDSITSYHKPSVLKGHIMALPSKREFLSKHTNPATGEPFAKFPSRGRFSAEAEAFAADNADKWAEAAPAPKAPAVPKQTVVRTPSVPAQREASVIPEDYNPKDVRAWAAQNGHEVGQRGRIPVSVLSAYAQNNGHATVPRASRPTVVRVPVRSEREGYTLNGGALVVQTLCGSCSEGIQFCKCSLGPQAYGGPVGGGNLILGPKPVV